MQSRNLLCLAVDQVSVPRSSVGREIHQSHRPRVDGRQVLDLGRAPLRSFFPLSHIHHRRYLVRPPRRKNSAGAHVELPREGPMRHLQHGGERDATVTAACWHDDQELSTCARRYQYSGSTEVQIVKGLIDSVRDMPPRNHHNGSSRSISLDYRSNRTDNSGRTLSGRPWHLS